MFSALLVPLLHLLHPPYYSHQSSSSSLRSAVVVILVVAPPLRRIVLALLPPLFCRPLDPSSSSSPGRHPRASSPVVRISPTLTSRLSHLTDASPRALAPWSSVGRRSPSRLCSMIGEFPGRPLAEASPSRLCSPGRRLAPRSVPRSPVAGRCSLPGRAPLLPGRRAPSVVLSPTPHLAPRSLVVLSLPSCTLLCSPIVAPRSSSHSFVVSSPSFISKHVSCLLFLVN
ncbi:hypothetical protein Scep_004217 [Stephania cephalantha]|uniref:Uncharacterized protein n=1 Tax=Stephania cephalantha TaxID=152367 RepID=A0AAP0PV77_9MAGN